MQKMTAGFRILLFALLGCTSSSAFSDVILTTGRILESLSGSLNTISGVGILRDGQLDLPSGAILTRLEFELIAFDSIPDVGMPQSLTVSFLYRQPFPPFLDAAGVSFSSITGISVGQTVSLNPFAFPYNFENPVLGLFQDFDQRLPEIQGGASWAVGGVNATATAEVEIRAFGTLATPIPEPNSIALVCIALAAILGFSALRRNRTVS